MENRGHIVRGCQCLGHLEAAFCSHSLPQLRAKQLSCVLKTQCFYEKSYFVTHSNDQYQLAEVFKHFPTGRMCSLRHSAHDLKPFLQEGGTHKLNKSRQQRFLCWIVALWRNPICMEAASQWLSAQYAKMFSTILGLISFPCLVPSFPMKGNRLDPAAQVKGKWDHTPYRRGGSCAGLRGWVRQPSAHLRLGKPQVIFLLVWFH